MRLLRRFGLALKRSSRARRLSPARRAPRPATVRRAAVIRSVVGALCAPPLATGLWFVAWTHDILLPADANVAFVAWLALPASD